MIEVLLSEEKEKIKFKNVIHDYKIIFQQKGELAEFYVWDDDYDKRIQINAPLDRIRSELWNIMKPYI